MLDVVDVTKAYGGTPALQGVSLSIPKGVCYGLLGPNGAGKTTLLSIITGTQRPDAGTVKLDGQFLTPSSYAVKRRIGYVPQDLALYEDLSAQDNLRFFATIYGFVGEEMHRRMDRSLEIAGLSDRRKSRVSQFSGGMKRRLNLAVAILHDPKFLVLDEPTVGVDPQSRNLIFDALQELVNGGMTLLLTSHYMEEVERLCERVAIIDRGKVIAEDRTRDLHRFAPSGQSILLVLDRSIGEIGLPGAEWEGTTLRVPYENLDEDLPSILQNVALKGGKVVDLKLEQTSLEQVFLHLTGHSLRD